MEVLYTHWGTHSVCCFLSGYFLTSQLELPSEQRCHLETFLNGNQQRWCFSMLWYPIDIKNPNIDWLALFFFWPCHIYYVRNSFWNLLQIIFFYKGSHENFATCRINLRHKQRFRALFYRTPWNGDVTQRVIQKQKAKHIWMQIEGSFKNENL